MRKFLATLTLATCFFYSHAQVSICGTDALNYEARQLNPQLALEEQKANERTLEVIDQLNASGQQAFGKKAGVIYIPVVFHVIHNGGTENITQAQIMDQLRVLNEDFRKIAGTNGAASTNGLAVDMEFEFRLAQLDPNGNRHDGINRIQSTLTENARNNVKSLISWPSDRYLNVWIVKSIQNTGQEGTVLGYAQFPYSMNSTPSTDGIVLRADYTGTIITGNSNNAGRTLTHEAGHWIGLYHTFQDGCVGATPSTCASQGDWVCDTPPVENATNGCLTSRTSCGGQAMIENYMDYMDGKCANTYTGGQKSRAMAQMSIYRSKVYSDANLVAAGITSSGTYLPVAASSIKAPYSYGFEDANIANAGWRIQNLNNGSNAWKSDNNAASGSKSLGYRSFLINSTVTINTRDEFNSPLIDLTPLSNPSLSFKVAYARTNTSTNDILDVYISGDFGRTETRLFRGGATNIERAAGPSATEYIPESGDWKMITLDLTPYASMTNARIRFEFINRRGNNIYVDDFSISAATGLSESLKKDFAFNVFPNPMNDVAYAQFEVKQAEDVNITILDLVGRSVKNIHSGKLQSGMYSMPIDKTRLTPGIYLINVETPKGTFAHKLVVN
jgi:hypothetical protein